MTTIEALQNLYEALGGEPSAVENINTIPAMLSEISGQLSGGGGLPDVTADDDGKVLKVVDGEWDKAEGSNKIYNITYNSMGSQVILSDGKTIGDILKDINNGVNVILRDFAYFYRLIINNNNYIKFISWVPTGETSIGTPLTLRQITFFISNITKNTGEFTDKSIQI
jgi:hypothetical protein